MSITISQAAGMKFEGSAPADKVTTIAEAGKGQGADGSAAPKGTTPIVIERGDTISQIMAKYGLDWSNPADRAQFLKDNPQFAELGGGRNPDLVWPGEVVYIHTGGETRASVKEETGGGKGKEEAGGGETTREAAAKETKSAEEALEQARKDKADYIREYGSRRMPDYLDIAIKDAEKNLVDSVRKEIEAGLSDYLASHPNASAADIRKEAARLQHEIQGRSTTTSNLSEDAVAEATQQAINNASARQHGVDLGGVDPDTAVKDGPYTESSGPFEPNSSVKLKDSTYIKTDENGWPDKDVDNDGKPDPQTKEAASKATDEAARELADLKAWKHPGGGGGLQIDRSDELKTLTEKVGNAIQREIELGLREYISANPDATPQQIQAEAKRLANEIMGRPGIGDVASESFVSFRMEQAIAAVTKP